MPRVKFNRRMQKLYEAQDGICPICGERFVLTLQKTQRPMLSPSIEHVMPTSKGGSYRGGNILLTHSRCNHHKGDRLPTGCEIIWLIAVCERLSRHLHMIEADPPQKFPPVNRLVRNRPHDASTLFRSQPCPTSPSPPSSMSPEP